MNIYLRKILKHDITHQISVTKEILNNFFGVYNEKESTQVRGKKSGFIGNVTFLLSTDPRFGGDIKQVINNEGGMEEDDILLFVKSKNGYVLEIINKNNDMHKTFLAIMAEERHLILNVDDDNEKPLLDFNVYGIHIKRENTALSEENPHICIGWSALGDLSDIATKDELSAKYSEIWPENKVRTKAQDVGQIWRFLKEIRVGDYVVFADGGVCHIGKVVSDYYFDKKVHEAQSKDYANTRKVEWLKKNISRRDLSEAFHHSLMTAMSVWGLNDYKSAVYELLNGTYVKDDIKLDEADLILDNINSAKNLNVQQLVQILNDIYSSASANNKSNAIRMFGFKYAESIMACGVSPQTLVDDSIIDSNSYGGEITKAINMYNSIKNNEFGVTFVGDKRQEVVSMEKVVYISGCKALIKDYPENGKELIVSRNRIFFGAPGTGKSHILNQQTKNFAWDQDVERVTFYPDYTYANFVGTYKPVSFINEEGKRDIKYEFVPGPFMRTYLKAIISATKGENKPFVLIIEEINRANVAAVFGDIFQLLDRKDDGTSQYSIKASEDVKNYLEEKLAEQGIIADDKLLLPDNMFIWATMNSADQGVFPMDTAFKRRWDFTYLSIDESQEHIAKKYLKWNDDEILYWNPLRKAINYWLSKEKINEDKLLGPFFLSYPDMLSKEDKIDKNIFVNVFKNKVIMYLFEDAAKSKRPTLFAPCTQAEKNRFSEICKEFEANGIKIFHDDIQTHYNNYVRDLKDSLDE